jgi:uncharacterized repeat protein (TIGR01451 family)
MSTNRSFGRRLRLESLEGREVPAVVTGTDPTASDPTVTTQTSTDPSTTPTTTTDTSSANPVVVTNTGGTNTTTTATTATTTTTTTTGGGTGDGSSQSPAVDLGLTVSADKSKPSIGDVVTLKVTMANSGPVQATGAAATVTLPAGMTFVSSDGGTSFDPTTGTWTPGTVAAQSTTTLTIKATVTDPTAQPVTATITGSDQTDNNTANNSATLNVTPVLAKLNLMKSMSNTVASTGSILVMTVAVGNGGQGRARNVAVTDTFPDGLTFVKALSATQGSYNPTTHTWTVGTVAPGTIAVLRVMVMVTKTGPLSAPSAMTGTGYDTTLSKLAATSSVTGTKPNPATWAFYGGPNFSISPGPIPAAAQGSSPWAGAIINPSFLMTHGFKLQ